MINEYTKLLANVEEVHSDTIDDLAGSLARQNISFIYDDYRFYIKPEDNEAANEMLEDTLVTE